MTFADFGSPCLPVDNCDDFVVLVHKLVHKVRATGH
ncbi:hypothetical protein DP49_5957 [Burkholderia pseudomallei]|nr:hypothetical protein DP49_5957 [Burkholderia pseudomallei]